MSVQSATTQRNGCSEQSGESLNAYVPVGTECKKTSDTENHRHETEL